MQKFLFDSKVFPGQIINLLAGMNPDVNAPFSSIVSEGTDEITSSVLDNISKEDSYFGPFPILNPCENWSSLVNLFFSRYKVNGRREEFSGSAMIQKYSSKYSEATQAVADMLGIDKKYADDSLGYCFVLAKVQRNMPNAIMNLSADELNSFKENIINQYSSKMKKFELSLDKDGIGNVIHTPGNIEKSLSLMKDELGTHYVYSVEIGDEAYQVFVYTKENYKLICEAMNKSGWEDENALGFRYFTSNRYCEHTGKVCLISNDPVFEATRKLLLDPVYNLDESIFNLILNEQVQTIVQDLNNVVCVGVELRPISNLKAESSNKSLLLKSTENVYTSDLLLDSVAIQGCITRFGADGAGPATITGNTNVNYAQLYETFGQMDTFSMIWSPYLSISQMYVCLDDLWKTPALNKTGVKHLLITSDVIEIKGDIDLSSVETVTFACRLFISGKDGSVPTITLSSTSWNPLRLYCGSMKGTCVFEEKNNINNHQLVFDSPAVSLSSKDAGVVFNDFFAGKFPTGPFFETGKDVDTLWRKTSLQSGLEMLLMTCSIPLSPQAIVSDELRKTAIESWNCLKWISDSTRQVVDGANKITVALPEELALVYTHSAMLVRSVADPSDLTVKLIPQVPPLRYTAYEDAVDKLLDVTKEYGNRIDITRKAIDEYNHEIQRSYVESQRDESIKKIAKFMLDQNKALASYEEDLTQAHNQIINKKKETILELAQRETEIRAKYADYSAKLEEAKDDMVSAIKQKCDEEITKAVFETVFGVVEFFAGMATGVGTLATLGKAEKAEKVLKKFEAFMKFAEQLNKGIEIGEKLAEHIEIITTLEDSTPKDFAAPPTDIEWDIFLNDSEAQVRPAEDYIKQEVENYIAIVRDITTISKSLNAVLAQKASLRYDIWAEEVSRSVSKKQADRLNSLSIDIDAPQWTPDTDYLADLGQFNAVLRQKQNVALIKLMELVRLQDASMTYYYLSKPTIITQFDIISIQEGLASQALAAVQALETYPYPPTDLKAPLEVKVDNISVTQLTNDMGVEIQVQMNQGLFDTLAHVRINSLDVRIDGVTTNTGKCHVQLETVGNPMLDRGFKREMLSYQMISREWHIVYDLESGKTIIGTQPASEWGQYFTKPTPFQTFRVSIPNTPENDGLSFGKQLTSVTLSFMLEAAYSKAPKRLVLESEGIMLNKEHDVRALNTTTDPSSFFGLLKGASVTDGWDVVSFLAVDKINTLWEERWNNELKGEFHEDKMFTQAITINYTQKIPGGMYVIYEFNMTTGAPWIKFVADDDQSALINIPIIKGTLISTTYSKDGKPLGQDSQAVETTEEKPVLIKTKAKLQDLPGEVDANTVYIDPAQDAFKFENIELDPQVDVGLCNEVVEYFKTHKLKPWKLGTLRLNTDIDFLKPTKFYYKTFTPPDTHTTDWPAILGMFILTTTPQAPAHGIRRMWPDAAWPVSMDYDASVFFSSDLLWNKEIIPAVKQQIGDAQILKDATGQNYIKLAGTTNVCNLPVYLKDGYEARGNYKIVTEYAKVDFDLSTVSLKFNFSSLEMSCNTSWEDNFPYQGRTPIPDPSDPDVSLSVDWDKVTFNCSFNVNSYPSIDENNFNVSFTPFDFVPTVTESHPSHSFLGLPLPQIKQSVIDNAKAAITNKVGKFKINLSPMPMFAVSNILFPESKVMDPKYVYCTGDLLIVGSVVRNWVNPNS